MKEKREFNFARRWEQEQAKIAAPTSVISRGMIAWGIGGTVVVLAISSSPWLWDYKLGHDLQSVNQKIIALHPVEIQLQKVSELKSKIQSSKQFLDLVKTENHDPIEVLKQLKLLLPVGTVVNSFSYVGDTISIAVSIPVPLDVARLWVSLRNSDSFQNVDIQSVSLVDTVQKLSLSLKYNPKVNLKVPVPLSQFNSGQSNPSLTTTDDLNQPDTSTENTSTSLATNADNNNNTSTNSTTETNTAILYPGIPKGIVANPASSSRIDLSWSPALYASSYNVYRSTSLKGGYIKVANVNEPNYIDSGLDPGTAYYYKISSLKDSGVEGYFDNPVGTVTFDLDTPTSFKVTTSSGQIDLTWNSVNGATAYRIYRSSEGGLFILIATVADTKYSDKGLSVGNYKYKINALADNKTGGITEIVSTNLSN